jgi:hypothetical protein
MKNTYTWKIDKIDCFSSDNNNSNVISRVYFHIEGTDGNQIGTWSSVKTLPAPSNSFISYKSITEETIINWLMSEFTEYEIKQIYDRIDFDICSVSNSPYVTLPLPWAENVKK